METRLASPKANDFPKKFCSWVGYDRLTFADVQYPGACTIKRFTAVIVSVS